MSITFNEDSEMIRQNKCGAMLHSANSVPLSWAILNVPNCAVNLHGQIGDSKRLRAAGGKHHVYVAEQIIISHWTDYITALGTQFLMIPIKTIVMFWLSGWNNYSEPN